MLKVTWDKTTCTHAGVCVTTLTDAFKIDRDQLVNNAAATDEKKLREVCATCPSGALSANYS